MKSIRGILYAGLIVLFALALGVSVTNWVRAKQEMQEMTTSNITLRTTLGDLTHAISERDREIDDLEQRACNTEDKSKRGLGLAPQRASRP
jgi:uncharacterized protein HemX